MNEEELKNKSYSDIKENFKEEFNNTSDEFKNEYFKSLELDLKFNEDYIDNLNFMKNSAEENASDHYRELIDILDERISDIKDNFRDKSDEFIREKVNEEIESYNTEKLSSVFKNVREIENEIDSEKEYGSKLENEIKEFKEDFKDVLVLENKIESDETLTKAGELFEKRDELKELLENTTEGKFFIEQELDSVLEKINNLTTAELKEHNDSLTITDEMRDVQSGIQERSENMGKGSSDDIIVDVKMEKIQDELFNELKNLHENKDSDAHLAREQHLIDEGFGYGGFTENNEFISREADKIFEDVLNTYDKEISDKTLQIEVVMNMTQEEKVGFIEAYDDNSVKAINNLITEESLDKLIQSSDDFIKLEIAKNENASPDTLEKLASSDNKDIRDAVIDNSNSSERAKDIAEKINEISSSNEVSSSFKTEEINTEKATSSLKM